MIGALLSNTPAALLKNSGVAGVDTLGSDGQTRDRISVPVGESPASARVQGLLTGTGPLLTSQAVVALQETDSSPPARTRPAEVDGSSIRSQSEAGTSQDSQDREASARASNPGASSLQPVDQGARGDDGGDDGDGDGLNEAEEKQVQELKARDREVRAHEQAHARVGGAYASAPTYTFQQGPDGKRYAVGGEVQIDTSRERTPEATIRKMRVVIAAALAPAEPSGQDLKVAQQARSQLSEAQTKLRQQKAEELKGEDGDNQGAGAPEEAPAATSSSDERATAEGRRAGDTGGTFDERRQLAEAISAYQAATQRSTGDLFAAGLASK